MKKFLVLMAAMLLMMSTAAFADSITWQITGVNQVTFSVQNTGVVSSPADAISGFFFQCATCSGGPTVTNSGTGATIDLSNSASPVIGSTTDAGWGVGTVGGSYFMTTFKILGGANGPAYTILGDTYSCAGGGICDNAPHNPFLYTPTGTFITFVLTIPGLTSADQLTGVDLWYGTAAPTGTPQTPEPASLFLLGTGLVGLGGAIRKKIRV